MEDGSHRLFDKSREPEMKKARMSNEPKLRDPPISNPDVTTTQPTNVPSWQMDRESEANDSNEGGYHPTHQLFSELVSEYRKGLAELTSNSKQIITKLTIIAGENLLAANAIAETICTHIIEVPSEHKLPCLYLLDSIVKNIGGDYNKYFSTKLPEVFCKTYRHVDPSIHAGMRRLFQTWGGVFPLQPLQMIEEELGISLAANDLGSVSARSKPEPQSQHPQKSIHLNPKYLEARQKLQPPARESTDGNGMSYPEATTRRSVQSADHARVLGVGVTSAGASSSLTQKALQSQMARPQVTGALAKSHTNNNATVGQKRPAPPSRQPTSHQWSSSPSFSAGHDSSALHSLADIDLSASHREQRGVSNAAQISGQDNAISHGQHNKKESSPMIPQSGKKRVDSQKSNLIPHPLPMSQQQKQKLSLPQHSRSEGTQGRPSELSVRNLKQPVSEVPKMSAAPITTSSHDFRSAPSVFKFKGPPTLTTASKALSKNTGEEKTVAPNPFSNIPSTLMEKGLIISSKNESSTTLLMSNESQDPIPGVISMSLPATIAPALPFHSLFGGNKVSTSQHAANKPNDNPSDVDVKSLIGFEFKQSLIRQLHEPVIKDLFDDLPYRCDKCILQFKIQETLDRHMEWHSSKELGNEYASSSRWFSDSDDWVAGKLGIAVDPVDGTEEIKEAAIEDEQYMVLADESQCVCILCGELFEDYYSQEEDAWMFRGAMQVKIMGTGYENITTSSSSSRDLIVHTECFTESPARELGLVTKSKTG